MLSFKLVSTLIHPEDPEWGKLVSLSLGQNIHPDRARGFCLSREALKCCFMEKGIDLKVKDLIIEKYHKLEGQNSLTISLSHTSSCGAAVVGEVEQFTSVGIDVEPLQRPVKEAILERISHPQDISILPISLWALKEASFKALMNTGRFENPVEFSSLKITPGKWTHSPTLIEGEWSLIEEQGFIVALAWIRT